MTSDSKITPGVVYKAVLLAFGLVIAAMIFHALTSLVLGVLIVVIIATPLSAFADMLQRRRVPRALGAVLGLLLGLAAIAGLVALIVPVFTTRGESLRGFPARRSAIRSAAGSDA